MTDYRKLEEVDLHVTNRCNFKCMYCWFRSGRFGMQELSFEEISNLLSNLLSLDVQELHITGGEPFLRSDIFSIIQFAKDAGFAVRVQTNGSLLDHKKLLQLRKFEVDQLMVSLDSTNASVNNLMRGTPHAYIRARQTIIDALSVGLNVRVNCTVFRTNVKGIPSLLKELVDLGVHTVSFFLGTPLNKEGFKTVFVSPKMWLRTVERLQKQVHEMWPKKTDVVVEKGYIMHGSPEESSGMNIECKIRRREHCIVLCDGRVFPCVFLIHLSNPLGSLKENSFVEIWKHSQFWEYHEKTNISRECATCQFCSFCKGGCKGYTLIASDTFLNRDPRCLMKEDIIPICPIIKMNLYSSRIAYSTAEACRH